MRLTPFFRIGGTSFLKPPLLARVQTDGSYRHAQRLSRTAVIIDDEHKLMKVYAEGEHANSTESEWASILDGLLFSHATSHGAVELENDTQGVIRSLYFSQAKKDMDRYYLHAILEQARALEWVGVRWIPRELNRADRLFRL